MKRAKILFLVLTLVLLGAALLIGVFAAPEDLTVKKSANFNSLTVGTSYTASDSANPTLNGVKFQQGGRAGKIEVKGTAADKYVLITQTDKVGTSTPYAYLTVGSQATQITTDGVVTGFTPSANDVSNFKFMVFEIDVMSPTGKFIAGNLDIQGRRVGTSGATNSYWNPNSNATIVRFGYSNGASYLYADFDQTLKKYVNPFEFTNIQLIVENITTAESTNYELQTHVYVNGELWFTKVASNVPTAYFGGKPNGALTELRVNYTLSTDSTYTLAIDNISYSTVPVGSDTVVSDIVKQRDGEKVPTYEYVSGGNTVIGYDDTSLANAIYLADADTTVKLLADCKHDGPGISITKNLTLDLNGKTIDATIDRQRRDTGLFVVSSNKTFNIKSSVEGAKIFSAANGTSADPLVATNTGSVLNVKGNNDKGDTTLSFYGSSIVRAWSGDCTVSVDGGEYYRTRSSDYGLIQLQKNFTLSVKNAFLYDMAGEATDGVFTLNGRFAVGTSVISKATVDNCVIISTVNVVSHAFSKADILFTDCYISGDINPAVFSNETEGTQTAGTVTLGKGCIVNGRLSENVVTADGYVMEKVPNSLMMTANYNTFKETDGVFDESSFVINSYDLSLDFDRFVCKEGSKIPVVWKDSDGEIIAITEGIRGESITATPYDQFVKNGATYEYIKDWVNAVPDEWNESMDIPESFEGEQYVLTFKEGGRLIPYEATFKLLFNISSDSYFRVNYYVPTLPSGLEITSLYLGDKLLFGTAINGENVDLTEIVKINGESYYHITDTVGVISAATEKLTATVKFECDGYVIEHSVSTDMAEYCNTVLAADYHGEKGHSLVSNVASYLVACADALKLEYTDVTNALSEIAEDNLDRLIRPSDSQLVIPDTSDIQKYVSSANVIITDLGPVFVFNLTEEGKAAEVSLSCNEGNGQDEHYSTVGWIKTGNDSVANINRTAISIKAPGGAAVTLTYAIANYCKALEGTDSHALVLALYGLTRSQMSYCDIPDASIEKYTGLSEAITVAPGDKITYYTTVTNYEQSPLTLTLTDRVPENTEYVSGDAVHSDGILTFDLTVPAGEALTVSYTVKVDDDTALCDGGVIESTEVTGGKMSAKAESFYVEITLNTADRKFVDYAIDALADSKFSNLILAKWIYNVAYSRSSSYSTDDPAALMDSIVNGTAGADILDRIAPTLYGGSKITAQLPGVKGAPAGALYSSDLIVGDVIISVSDGSAKCYIYGSDGLYSLAEGCQRVDTDSTLAEMSSSEAYAVLRTSANFVNFTPTDLDRTPDVLTDKQQAIVDTAKYYLQRGEWLQYDDTYLCYAQTTLGNESRWEAGIRTPEENTKQDIGYINCAAFTHDVYWSVFGKALPNGMYTTALLTSKSAQNNMNMYSFTRAAGDTHTEEEKAAVQREFLETLEPGDIMVILRGTSGHAMLYIGDGLFIHSTGSSYNYSGSYGVETYEPTIRYNRVMDYLFNPESTNGYVFNKVTSLSIVRPLNNSTWANYPITENAQNRIDNLMGITAEKLPSVGVGQTLNPGDDLTYTFSVRNDNYTAKTLEISDLIPEGTELVLGGDRRDGNTLYWTVNVPARSTVEVSYTVKVCEDTAYGTVIRSDSAKIGGVIHKSYSTVVRRTLTLEEQAAIKAEFEILVESGTALTGIDLVNELYKRALGIEGIFATSDHATITEGADGIFTAGTLGMLGGKQAYMANPEGYYYKLIAPTLYGGRRISSPHNENKRTELAYRTDLVIGDVFEGRTSSSRFFYIYLGGEHFVSLTTHAEITATVDQQLERGPAYAYHYAILRPSFALEGAQ